MRAKILKHKTKEGVYLNFTDKGWVEYKSPFIFSWDATKRPQGKHIDVGGA